ncbi:MAG: MFS transporter [Sphingomonadales bacterium]|nr:MFS transporter [Sphingomonadales bacterium]
MTDLAPSASPPPGVPGSLTLRQANLALAVFLAAYVLSFVDRQILGLMVDPIRRDLGLSDLQIGLLQGAAFALLYATLGVPFGMSVDRWSRRNLIVGGIITWSVATALCGLAGSFAALFAARVLVGVGEATLSPAVHSYLSDAYPRHRLARAMAIYNLGITLGSGMALIIGGWVVALIARSGMAEIPGLGALQPWQAAFLAVAAPGVPSPRWPRWCASRAVIARPGLGGRTARPPRPCRAWGRCSAGCGSIAAPSSRSTSVRRASASMAMASPAGIRPC